MRRRIPVVFTSLGLSLGLCLGLSLGLGLGLEGTAHAKVVYKSKVKAIGKIEWGAVNFVREANGKKLWSRCLVVRGKTYDKAKLKWTPGAEKVCYEVVRGNRTSAEQWFQKDPQSPLKQCANAARQAKKAKTTWVAKTKADGYAWTLNGPVCKSKG